MPLTVRSPLTVTLFEKVLFPEIVLAKLKVVPDKLSPVPALYWVFVSVEAIVIAPSAFVIVTLLPAVRVAFSNILFVAS